MYLVGIRQNLPHFQEVDEATRVTRAVAMVANWNPNPGWFGHPSSTVFYPLAFAYYLWNVLFNGGPLWGPDPSLLARFEANQAIYYLVARWLTIAYGLLSLPLVFLVGRRAFGERTAVLAVWLTLTYTAIVAHAQVARDDSAGLFFALLGLWLSLRFYERPTARYRLLAGVSIGLAVSSRYFLAAFTLPLLAAEAAHLWPRRAEPRAWGGALLGAALGTVAVALGFALSTPFFFLDSATALADLTQESRNVHLGADGLSPLQNFAWYVTTAVPRSVSWTHALLALVGAAVAFAYRRIVPAFMALMVVAFLAALSLHGLHWQRWTIQILPLVALLAADAALWLPGQVAARLRLDKRLATSLLCLALALVLGVQTVDLALFAVRQATPSTRIRATEWLLQNAPPGSKIAFEHYSIFPVDTPYVLDYRQSLASDRTLAEYRKEGFDYLVVCDEIYNRFLFAPERYPREAAFYRELFTSVPLAAEFLPSPARPGTAETTNLANGRSGGAGGGTVIRIYRLQGK